MYTEIELNKVVNETLDENEIQEILDTIISVYGVNDKDVVLDIDYITSGSFDVDVSTNTDINEMLESMEEILSDILGVHDDSLTLVYDPETETVEYTITGDSVENINDINDIFDSINITDEITNRLEEQNLDAIIENHVPEEEIELSINGVVDITDAESNNVQANVQIEEYFDELGYDTTVTSNIFNFLFLHFALLGKFQKSKIWFS